MKELIDIDPILDESNIPNSSQNNHNNELKNVQNSKHSLSILQGLVFIEDAINFRSIFHKIDNLTLVVYRCYYSKHLQALLHINIFIILMLPFFENPSSLSKSSDILKPDSFIKRYTFRCGILESIDFFCLILFFADACVKTYLIGKKQLLKTPWLITYFVVLIISITDCIISLLLGCNETYRIRRYLRPIFLIQSSSLMKKTIKCLKKTVPQIVSVFVLLFIHVYFFALIGMHIFPRKYLKLNETDIKNSSIIDGTIENHIFRTIGDSLLNLFILITTSNNPDVMIQSYSENRFAALFFILYVIIGLYCIMSLVTAVIYNHFKGFFHDSMQSSAFRKSIGIRAAFWILYNEFGIKRYCAEIPKSCVKCVIENLSSISKRRKKILIKIIDEVPENRDPDENEINIGTMRLKEFENLFLDNLNNDSEKEFDISNTFYRTNLNKYELWMLKIKTKLNIVISTKYFMYVTCIMTLINISCITAELVYLDQPEYSYPISYVLFLFSIYYVIENLLKIWSINWRKYSMSLYNVSDGIIAICNLVLQIVHFGIFGRPYVTKLERAEMTGLTVWGISRVVNMLMIFRLINLAPSISVMYAIISTFIDIIRSLRPIFGIVVVNYYIFGLLGIQLFENAIKIDSFNETKCGSYKQLNYWAINFNDFYSALVVLWNLMVINNWQTIFQAFLDVKNNWGIIYFIVWWIFCTVITLNMCISLILDLFVMKCEKPNDYQNSKKITANKSIHNIFSDPKWRPNDKKLNDELSKHPFFDFKDLLNGFVNFEETVTIN